MYYVLTPDADPAVAQHLIDEGVLLVAPDGPVVTVWPDDPKTGVMYSVRKGGTVPRGRYRLILEQETT